MSWQSRSTLSRAPESLAALPQAGENIEQLIAFANAQVIAGPGPSPLKNTAVNLEWGESFETVWSNFSVLSETLRITDPSDDLRQRLEAIPKSPQPRKLLYLNRAGGSAGPGTFVQAVFDAVGAENVITTPGWQSPDTEALLQLKPDVIVTSFMASNYAGVNDRTQRQDALAKWVKDIPHIDIPGSLWPCAGPGLVDAAETLASELRKL